MSVLTFQRDRRSQQLRKLTEVSRALTYAVSLEEVLDLTVRRAVELLEADKAILMLTNEEGLLSVRASHGLDPALCQRFSEPLQETLITRLQALLETRAPADFLGVPLVVGGEVTGMLAVSRSNTPDNVEEEEWLLSALADQASVALEKTRLDELAEFRERLIGIVSHDLRNPVAVILTVAHTLVHWHRMDDSSIEKSIIRIKHSAERASRMIRDLLDFTQARLGGGIPIGRKPSDLHAIVRQVVEEFQIAHSKRDIVLTHQGNAEGEWDADRLAQVVGNLLSNAIQYSPGETPVTIRTEGVDESAVVLCVSNTGAAIPSDLLPTLFQPMRRASADLSNANRSVGLGLYIVKHLVEAHGGSVTVSSRDGEGTHFRVKLPRDRADSRTTQ